jgi:hypothetical protein
VVLSTLVALGVVGIAVLRQRLAARRAKYAVSANQ